MSTLPPGAAERRRDLLVLVLGAAILFGAGLGARDLWNPNEPVYGLAVAEMVRGDLWLLPTVNGEPFDEKPILYFWLARVGAALTGRSDELVARLPAVASGVACVLLLYLLVWPYAGKLRARLAAVLLATTFVVSWSARQAQMDLLLAACVLGALVALSRVIDHDGPALRCWSLAGAATGLGFLSKGPVAPVCIGLVVLGHVAWRRRWDVLKPAHLGAAAGTAILVAAPWFLALIATGHADAVYEMLYRQNVGRAVAPWDHQRPWWYFLKYFWIDMAPWSVFVPLAAALPGRDASERRLDGLAWIWIAAYVAFFSWPVSKRSVYLLPAAPAVAVLVSGAAERLLLATLPRVRTLAARAIVGAYGVLFVAAAGYLWSQAASSHPLLRTEARTVAVVLLAGGVCVIGGLTFRALGNAAAPAALIAALCTLYVVVAVSVLPAVDLYKSPRGFCEIVNGHVGEDDELRGYRFWKWRVGYSYYTGRAIPRIESSDDLVEYWARNERVFLIVERGFLDEVRATIGAVEPLAERAIGANRAFLLSNR